VDANRRRAERGAAVDSFGDVAGRGSRLVDVAGGCVRVAAAGGKDRGAHV